MKRGALAGTPRSIGTCLSEPESEELGGDDRGAARARPPRGDVRLDDGAAAASAVPDGDAAEPAALGGFLEHVMDELVALRVGEAARPAAGRPVDVVDAEVVLFAGVGPAREPRGALSVRADV